MSASPGPPPDQLPDPFPEQPAHERSDAQDAAWVQVDLAQRVAGVTRLAEIGAPLHRMADIQAVLDEVLRGVTAQVGAGQGALMLYDANTGHVSVAATVGFRPGYADELGQLRPGEGAAGTALARRAPVHVADVETDPLFARWRALAHAHGFRAVLAVPLLTLGDEVMGVLATYWPTARRADIREQALVDAYARQVAEMVARARLHGEARVLAAGERLRTAQLRQLADTALALSAVTTIEELLRIATEAAREIVGTHQAVTSRLYDGWERAATHVSLSEKYAGYRDYADLPKGLGVLNAVTRDNRPLRLTGAELVAHPDWRGLRDAPGHPPLPDYLAAPLVAADGRNLGLVQLSDKLDGGFTEEDESILVQLAQMTSAAAERLELIERERAARRDAERLAGRYRLLSEAGTQLSASLELSDALATVTGLVVPWVADWCAIDLVDGSGTVRRAHVQGPPLARREPPELSSGAAATVVRTSNSRLEPSVMVVPLGARGRVLGALTFVRAPHEADRGDTEEPYGEDDLRLAEELAARAGVAIDNASRFAFEREVAETLQRSLLPQALPMTSGVTAATRYLPGTSGTAVGGDWYDLIDLGDGRLGLVVGDVMGRGVAAASVMGQLRATVRAYALDGHEPAELLRRLDRVVQTIDETQLTTCVYGVYDTSTRDLTVATAGHLPPLLVTDDGARFLELEPGLPLGVGGFGFGQSRVPLPPGATVLLYTDGLVEGPDCPVDVGMARLLDAARTAPRTPEELCAHLLAALSRGNDHDDDTALLAVNLAPPRADDPHEPVELELPGEPGSAAAARHFVADALHARRLDRYRDVAVLLVSELVTNSFRHARTNVRVRVATVPGRLRVEVVDGSGQVPLPRHAVPDQDESGRGLLLVAGLSERWGTELGFGGKCVWFELDT